MTKLEFAFYKQKLLPCPFCGGEGELNANDEGFFVMCTTRCSARTTELMAQSAAIKNWNARSHNSPKAG